MLPTLAAVLSLLASAPSPAPADTCGPHAAAIRDAARALYDEGRYLDAARRYHALWTCGDHPRDLVNAVQSYLLAEHLAEGIDLWERSLAAGVRLDPPLRTRGEALVAAAASHTTPVVVELTVEGRNPPKTAELAVCRLAADGAPREPCGVPRTVEVPRDGASVALRLDRGPWRVQVHWPDRSEPATATLQVAAAPLTERLAWRPDGPPRRLAVGLLGAGGLAAAAGLGLGLVGWQYNVTETEANKNLTGVEGLALRTGAAGLGAAGLALLGSGAAVALTAPPKLRRFGAAGLVLGFTFAGAGLGLLADAARRHPAYDPEAAPDSHCSRSAQCIAGEQLAGALAAGLGSGLLVGGIAGLVADPPARPRSRYSLAPQLGRTFAGLRLRVTF